MIQVCINDKLVTHYQSKNRNKQTKYERNELLFKHLHMLTHKKIIMSYLNVQNCGSVREKAQYQLKYNI